MKKTFVFLIVCTFLLTISESKLVSSKSVPKVQVTDVSQRTVQERALSCPNNCSNNGVCNVANATCVCNLNYTGSDCSIMITVLTNGQSASNTAKTFVWQYYRVNSAYRGNSLSFLLNQTDANGDCDLYGKFNALPTRSNYDLRDISTSPFMQIKFNSTQVGTYYLGVYGFSTCSYIVKAVLTGSCPNDCSGHGSCLNGVCVCSGAWAGSDCSVPVTDLVSGTPVSGSVQDFQMTSYRVQVQDNNFLYVKLQQTSDGDCDLYIRKDNEPTIWLWDYANVTLNNVSTISITDAQPGYYYAGVYGFHACNFTIVAQTSTNCPNQCSKHGSCDANDKCQCDGGYSGDYCQTRNTTLGDSEAVNGYVELNSWNYFSYTSNSDNNMIVSITSSNGGDCDLYVRANSLPTRFKYDYQEIGTQTNFSLVIEDPGSTNWYIGIYGWSLCSFTISVTESAECPENCDAHGTCQANGACICDNGWAGLDCSSVLNPLAATGKTVTFSSVKVNAWVYYNVTVTSATTVLVQVKEVSTSGYLQVYVAKTTPTLTNFMYGDLSSNAVHRIAIDTPQGGANTWIVGVYGDAEQVDPNGTSFGIVAWSPVFV